MSTLSIPTPRTSSDELVDARFDALVRFTVPAQCPAPAESSEGDLESAFDLDYWQPVQVVPVSGFAPLVEEARPQRRESAPTGRVRVAPETQPALRPRPQASAPARVRLTRRGRALLVLASLTLALGTMTLLAGWATASLSSGTPEQVRVVEVAPGDTLYGIAGELAEPGEVREMVHRIQELNSLPGAQISEGQKLAVPRG